MITARSTKSTFQKGSACRQAGFTLIELLVVLGILGILATALVATIDPFEQLKKASDANIKNSSVELVNASLRYYTTHNGLPWHTVANNGIANCGDVNGAINSAIDVAPGATCVTGLIDDGELQTQFSSTTSITKEITLVGTASNTIRACYKPQSKSQQKDINTKYLAPGDASANATCKSQGGAVDCYWCAIL